MIATICIHFTKYSTEKLKEVRRLKIMFCLSIISINIINQYFYQSFKSGDIKKYFQDYKYLVKNMVQGLDDFSLSDGSLKERTTRGNRALWYHFTALGEAFIILEIARIANVEIPANLEKKLLKAAELFQDAYLDHSVIEPWAKKRHNSQASNGRQEFNSNLDYISFYSSWMPIFQLRYPEHRTAKWLNQELTSKSLSLKSNEITGVPIGCSFFYILCFQNCFQTFVVM